MRDDVHCNSKARHAITSAVTAHQSGKGLATFLNCDASLRKDARKQGDRRADVWLKGRKFEVHH